MSETYKDGSSEKMHVHLEYETIRGILITKGESDEIEKLEMRNDDIWVCTFPRSGTTLTQEIVYLVQTLDFDKANSVELDERFPIIEIKDDRFPYYKGVKYVEQMPSPRMVKTHLHFDFLPEHLQNGKGRIIYLARNPKDIITSYYHLLKWLDELRDGNEAWAAFFNSFIDGTALYCPWPRHVLKYWERRNDSNILFLKYEDLIKMSSNLAYGKTHLVKDLPNGVRIIAKFLRKGISDENVARICDHCSVDNMRKNDKANMSYWRDVKNVNDNSGGGFINKGKAGTWKNVLTAEESERINVLLKEVEKAGLTFELH